jgi:hypothetical protein
MDLKIIAPKSHVNEIWSLLLETAISCTGMIAKIKCSRAALKSAVDRIRLAQVASGTILLERLAADRRISRRVDQRRSSDTTVGCNYTGIIFLSCYAVHESAMDNEALFEGYKLNASFSHR